MALESVAITPKDYRSHDLWISSHVLSIRMDTNPIEWQPDMEHVSLLNQMIQGLARAAKAVALYAEDHDNPEFEVQPVEQIGDAIVLLSQLSEAIRTEVESK